LLKPDCVSRLIFTQTARAAISRRAIPDKQQKGKRAFFERVDKKMLAFNKAVSLSCAPFGQFVSKELLALNFQLMTRYIFILIAALLLAACQQKRESVSPSASPSESAEVTTTASPEASPSP
jgi:hypothetical protein